MPAMLSFTETPEYLRDTLKWPLLYLKESQKYNKSSLVNALNNDTSVTALVVNLDMNATADCVHAQVHY